MIILQSIVCIDAFILLISRGEILENRVNEEKGIRSLQVRKYHNCDSVQIVNKIIIIQIQRRYFAGKIQYGNNSIIASARERNPYVRILLSLSYFNIVSWRNTKK